MAQTARVDITAHLKDKVSKGLDQMNGKFNALNKTINVIKAAGFMIIASQVIRFTSAVITATLELAVLGSQLESTTEVFDKLAKKAGTLGTVELALLRKATKGTISDLELMRKVGAGVDAGLSFEQSRIAMQFLRLYSTAFGKDFGTLMGTIFTGLQRGSTLMLDDAGIIISSTDDMFKGMGELEKKTALVTEAIRQMAEKMPTLTSTTISAAEEADRLTAAWANFRAELGLGFDDAIVHVQQGILEMINMLRKSEGVTGAAETAERARLRAILEPIAATPTRGFGEAGERGRMSQERAQVMLDEINLIEKIIELGKKAAALPQAGLRSERAPIGTTGGTAVVAENLMAKAMAAGRDLKENIQEVAVEVMNLGDLMSELELFDAEMAIKPVDFAVGADALRDIQSQQREAILDRIEFAKSLQQPEEVQEVQTDVQERQAAERDKAFDDEIKQNTELLGIKIDFFKELERMENKNRDTKADGLRRELADWLAVQGRKLLIAGGTFEELLRLNKAYQDALAGIDKADEVEKKTSQTVSLIFDGDTSNLESSADVAAASLGLLVDQLRGVSPAASAAASGIGSIAQGLITGGPQGTFQMIAGGVQLLSLGLGIFSGESETARLRNIELTKSLQAAAEATGEFARELEGQSLNQLQWEFLKISNRLRGLAGDTFGRLLDDAEFFINERGALKNLSEQRKFETEGIGMVNELVRISEAIGVFSGKAITFRGAMREFNHAIRIENITDPVAKLDKLRSMVARFVNIYDGLDSDFSVLTSRDARSLKETIASLQRDITAEEIKIRKEQGDLVIANIRDTEKVVKRELDDLLRAQKNAAERSVRSSFDIQEIALRESFVGRFKGAAGDPLETLKLLQEAQNEINLLALGEQAALATQFSGLNDMYEQGLEANEQASQALINAVTAAAENTSLTFEAALAKELGSSVTSTEMFLTALKAANQVAIGDLSGVNAGGNADIVARLHDIRSSHVVDEISSGNGQNNTNLLNISNTLNGSDLGGGIHGEISGTVTYLQSLPVISTKLIDLDNTFDSVVTKLEDANTILGNIETALGDIETNTAGGSGGGGSDELDSIKTATELTAQRVDYLVGHGSNHTTILQSMAGTLGNIETALGGASGGGMSEDAEANILAIKNASELIQEKTHNMMWSVWDSKNHLSGIKELLQAQAGPIGKTTTSDWATTTTGHTWNLTFNLDGELAPESLREAYNETIEPLIEADLEPGGRLNLKAAFWRI